MEISGLDICAMETESIIGISGLAVINSSLHYEGATRKRLIVDNNSVRSISFGISGLGEISSNLRYDGHPRRCQGTSKDSPTYFFVKSFILL